jgi:chromosome partitioning protein
MTVPTIAFFNHKGGVGRTSLVYHLAWMYADLGHTVVAVDLDPQANLTTAFLGEDRVEELGEDGRDSGTIYDAINSLMRGVGDLQTAARHQLAPGLYVMAGDLALSSCEEDLTRAWLLCLEGNDRAFRVITALWRTIQRTAEDIAADVVLIDLGPNLGAINRAALIASDHVMIPVTPERASLQGLENLGATLRSWRDGWRERVAKAPDPALSLPAGTMTPAGYVLLRPVVRLDRPARGLDRRMAALPHAYATAVLGNTTPATSPSNDPNCLGIVRPYGSLMMMSEEAHKPMFHLKAADGALGSHARAALDVRRDFEVLARRIEAATWNAP